MQKKKNLSLLIWWFSPLNCPILEGELCMRGRNVRFGRCFLVKAVYESSGGSINDANDDGGDWHSDWRCSHCEVKGCAGWRNAAWVTALSFHAPQDGVPVPSPCADCNCHLRLIRGCAALRPHLLLRMSDRTAATYDQTLLSLCTCDSSLREALMCCQRRSALSCLDLPSPSVSVKQHGERWPVNSTSLYLMMNLPHTRHGAISSSGLVRQLQGQRVPRGSCDCAVILASPCDRLAMHRRRTRPSVVLDVWWIHTRATGYFKRRPQSP